MTAIENFLQRHYTDERLAALLAHAQDGKLSYVSCCCFIGVVTADHALQGRYGYEEPSMHYFSALRIDGSREAEVQFRDMCNDENGINHSDPEERDAERRRKLIPMILAEMDRREKLRQVLEPQAPAVETTNEVTK